MTVDYTPLVNGIIKLIAVVICVYIIPKAGKWITSKTTEQERSTAYNDISILVKAAQQMAEANGWNGAEKLAKVTEWAKEQGIDVDDPEFRQTVESLVYDIKNAVTEIVSEVSE